MVEISSGEAFSENVVKRFDAEYFGKNALAVKHVLSKLDSHKVSEFAKVTDGIHESIEFTDQGTIKILSAKHPKDNFIDLSNYECVSEEYHSRNPRTALRENDVIISTVGTIGNSAVITKDVLPANSDRHVGIIRVDEKLINPQYLSSFLVGKYGRTQSMREATGNVQLSLYISKLEDILVPRFSNNFESSIAEIVKTAHSARVSAAFRNSQAETLLLSALGLEQWQPPEALTYERSAKDVVEADRFDAEHFKNKYLDVWKKIEDYGIKTRQIIDIANPIIAGIDSREFYETGEPYIRVGDVKKMLINSDSAVKINLLGENVRKNISLEVGDILFTRKGSYGNAAVVRNGNLGSIISTEIIRIRIKNILKESLLPEYVALFLNSMPGKLQSEQWAHGVAFFSITQEDLLRFKIPIIDTSIQYKIKDYLNHSDLLNWKASHILESAKRAVEIAIEQSEEAAMEYLRVQEQSLSEGAAILTAGTNAPASTL